MIRALALLVVLSCFAVAGADDEPKLERKKKDPPEEKKELKKEAEPEPAKPLAPDEIEKAKERIVENSKQAGKRLGEQDPGAETQKVQNEILKDLDELLKQAMNQQNQQSGGGGGGGSKSGPGQLPNKGGGQKQSSSGGSSSRQERRERREQARNNPMSGDGQGGAKEQEAKEKEGEGGKEKESASNGGSPMNPNAKPTGKFAEVYKDVWGHLPEKLRQEMDLYYREQFMPRYTELLREYYSALAEQRRKSKE